MQKLPIPQTDWTPADGYILMLLCCPYDPAWIGTVRGRIWELATGRLWDEQTGQVTEVQKIGREIWESMATCGLDDLVTAVNTINVTIQANQQALADVITALGVISAAIEAGSASLLQDELTAIKNSLDAIQAAVQSGGSEELEDDLANIWGVLQSISTVLGGTVPPPPDPL